MINWTPVDFRESTSSMAEFLSSLKNVAKYVHHRNAAPYILKRQVEIESNEGKIRGLICCSLIGANVNIYMIDCLAVLWSVSSLNQHLFVP